MLLFMSDSVRGALKDLSVGEPRSRSGATFYATPVPGATTPTGCPTLTIFFFKLCWVVFRVYYCLVVSCGPKEPRGAP